MVSIRSEIHAFLYSRSEAVRAKDIDQLMSSYAVDVIYFDIVPPLQYVGTAALRERFLDWFDRYRSAIGQDIGELTVTGSGDVAVAATLIRSGGTLKNGREVEFWVRATTCCRRSEHGWAIVHEHVSLPVDLESRSAHGPRAGQGRRSVGGRGVRRLRRFRIVDPSPLRTSIHGAHGVSALRHSNFEHGGHVMGRLKLQMQLTVDGLNPEGQNDGLSWDEVRDYSRDLLGSADTIILGAKTAVDFIPHWDTAAAKPGDSWQEVARRIAQARKIVFSKTLEDPGWSNTEIERGDLAAVVRRLKTTNKQDIIVYGGVSFVSSLVKGGLIDEFHLFVNPVALGKGKSIFGALGDPLRFDLKKAVGCNSGHVLLHYEPKAD